MKEGEYLLFYNIEIHGDTEGNIWYNVTFQSGESKFDRKKFNSAKTSYIYNTVEKLADALKALPAPTD